VPVAPSGQALAGFGDRVLAFLIDCAINAGVAVVLAIPLFVLIVRVATNAADRAAAGEPSGLPVLTVLGLEAAFLLLALAWAYVYQVEMMHRSGQTIGKRAMKLRVVPLDPTARLTRGAATLRWLVEVVAAVLVPGFGWLDGLWQLWDQPYRQCLHDKVARTVVVKLAP
jgi:uncharacterized RDD family membrane protein YckC